MLYFHLFIFGVKMLFGFQDIVNWIVNEFFVWYTAGPAIMFSTLVRYLSVR